MVSPWFQIVGVGTILSFVAYVLIVDVDLSASIAETFPAVDLIEVAADGVASEHVALG